MKTRAENDMINNVGRKPKMPWSSLGENFTEKFYGSKLTIKTKMHKKINPVNEKDFGIEYITN